MKIYKIINFKISDFFLKKKIDMLVNLLTSDHNKTIIRINGSFESGYHNFIFPTLIIVLL